MPIKTLRDLDSGHDLPLHTDANGNVSCGPTGNSVWYFPAGGLIALWLVISILHPPQLVVFALQVCILAFTVYVITPAYREGGWQNVPKWVWLVLALNIMGTGQSLGHLL
jgi:hypothetical protein